MRWVIKERILSLLTLPALMSRGTERQTTRPNYTDSLDELGYAGRPLPFFMLPLPYMSHWPEQTEMLLNTCHAFCSSDSYFILKRSFLVCLSWLNFLSLFRPTGLTFLHLLLSVRPSLSVFTLFPKLFCSFWIHIILFLVYFFNCLIFLFVDGYFFGLFWSTHTV